VSWTALAVALAVPVFAAAKSELLAWRDPIYIIACFAGILGLCLLLVQALLISGHLPELTPRRARHIHRWTGGVLVAAVIIHVAGLWITSPPDVIDALLFRSPTPFSDWGVIAMWTVFAVAILAAMRRRLGFSPTTWRVTHSVMAIVIVTGTVVHALLIEGMMETVSKGALCAMVGLATLKVLADLLRRWRR
jgi:predicted ferric reductase